MDGDIMIQVIYEDGAKERFTKEIIPRDGRKVKAQKVLTKDEIHKIPELKNNKINMRDKTTDELKIESDIVQGKADRDTIEKKIEAERRKMAIDSMVASGKLTTEELTKIGE